MFKIACFILVVGFLAYLNRRRHVLVMGSEARARTKQPSSTPR